MLLRAQLIVVGVAIALTVLVIVVGIVAENVGFNRALESVAGSNAYCDHPVSIVSPSECILYAFILSGDFAASSSDTRRGMLDNPTEWFQDHDSLYLKYPKFFAYPSTTFVPASPPTETLRPSASACHFPVTIESSSRCIIEAYNASGYLADLRITGRFSEIMQAEAMPYSWLIEHPLLYSEYPTYFAQFPPPPPKPVTTTVTKTVTTTSTPPPSQVIVDFFPISSRGIVPKNGGKIEFLSSFEILQFHTNLRNLNSNFNGSILVTVTGRNQDLLEGEESTWVAKRLPWFNATVYFTSFQLTSTDKLKGSYTAFLRIFTPAASETVVSGAPIYDVQVYLLKDYKFDLNTPIPSQKIISSLKFKVSLEKPGGSA